MTILKINIGLRGFKFVLPCTQIIVTSLYIILFKVNIFDITKHDETEFSDVVVNSIIRGWAQGEKTKDQGEKTENLEIKMCHCFKPNIHIPGKL